jgi:hypothetical protein
MKKTRSKKSRDTVPLIGDLMTNKQSGDKMFLSAYGIPACILAHLFDILNKRREVNPPKNPQIRAALPIQEINYGCANILAQTCYFLQYYWALLFL